MLNVSTCQVWDLRKNALAYKMRGHGESVTGMELSPDGSYLLTNAMDDNLRIWDVRPYAPKERCVKILQVRSLFMKEKNPCQPLVYILRIQTRSAPVVMLSAVIEVNF